MHATLSLSNQDLWKYALPAPLSAVHSEHCYYGISCLNKCRYMQIIHLLLLYSTCFRLLQVLFCRKRPNPHHHHHHNHHPHPTIILQSLRVQAPKSIERKKSAPWSSPYICQGGKAGGAALMGRTEEQYHSICHKPFHL